MKAIKETISNQNTGKHICTLENESNTALEMGPMLASFKHKFQVWEGNPIVKYFYQGHGQIDNELKSSKEYKYEWLIVHPFSIFRFYWNILQFLVLLIGSFAIPLNLIYGPQLKQRVVRVGFNDGLEMIEIICDALYLADFALLFLTGHANFDKKKVYFTHKLILKNYPRTTQFCFDLISIISITPFMHLCMYLWPDDENLSWIFYCKIISLLKSFRVARLLIYFKYITTYFHRWYLTLITCRILMLCLIFLHLLTCSYISFNQYMLVYSMEKHSDLIVFSLQYPIIPVTGYFDMYHIAHNRMLSYLLRVRIDGSYDRVVGMENVWKYEIPIFALIATLGFFVFSILTVLFLQMILTLNSSSIKYYAIFNQVGKYIKQQDLPLYMQQRIFTYYDYRFQRNYFREATISNYLSEALIRDINLHSCRTLIETVPILNELPQEMLTQIVTNLKYKVFLYNDTIIEAGGVDNCMYFISRGSVAVTTPTGLEICHLQDGAYFGEIALLFPEHKRVANVVAIEICEVYKLERKHFLACFEDSSPYYKRIEQTAKDRCEKTSLLEEMHRKYLYDRTTKRRFRGTIELKDAKGMKKMEADKYHKPEDYFMNLDSML